MPHLITACNLTFSNTDNFVMRIYRHTPSSPLLRDATSYQLEELSNLKSVICLHFQLHFSSPICSTEKVNTLVAAPVPLYNWL